MLLDGVTKFDRKKRNDVLKSARVMAGSGASLAIGPFGYDHRPPPGRAGGLAARRYKGPLKLNDRIVSVAGRRRGRREYARLMDDRGRQAPPV
jgi:hypothetical protein